MSVQKQQKGFTIIEVVLVLAIAALIFLMIFIALPALQRGQRDTARKQDANFVATALNNFRSNNRGQMPVLTGTGTSFTDFRDQYVKELGQYDPANVTGVAGVDGDPTIADTDTIMVELGRDCEDTVSKRAAAVWIRLEASDATVCTDA